jgi:hypothetical protein
MKWWLSAFLFLFVVSEIKAQVVINELSSNSNPEWVELYNSSNEIVSISDWKITDGNTNTSDDLTLNGCIVSQGFRSFGRSSGWLNDTGGDTINLKDPNGNQINQVIYGSEGIVGIPQSGKSASRIPDGDQNWQILDSPTQRNDDCQIPSPSSSPTPASTPVQTPTVTPSPTPNDYLNLFISEYFPYPDSGNEWVEIYNPNDFDVDLNGWFVDDIADDGGAPIIISGIINNKNYKVFYLSTAFLNNGGDDVRLLNGNKTEKNKTSFESSIKEKSWSKDNNGNWCQIDPTLNSSNSSCPLPTPTPSTTPLGASPTPTPKPSSTPTPTPRPTPTATADAATPTPYISPIPQPTPYNSSPAPSPQIMGVATEKKPFWEIISIIFGSMLLGLSVIWYIIKIWQGEGVHQNLN